MLDTPNISQVSYDGMMVFHLCIPSQENHHDQVRMYFTMDAGQPVVALYFVDALSDFGWVPLHRYSKGGPLSARRMESNTFF